MSDGIDVDAVMAELLAGESEPEAPETAEAEAPVQEQAEAPKYSELEEVAIELGWNPNFAGSDRVSAKEFVKRQQGFLKRTSTDNRELKEQIKRHGQEIVRIQRDAWQRAQAEAQAKHREAVRDGDHQAAEAALQELKRPEPKESDAAPDDGIPQDVRATLDGWVAENAWFTADEDARAYAQTVYARQVQALGIDDPVRILPMVTGAVKKRFPEHWQTQTEPEPERPARPTAPAVNGTPRAAGTIVRASQAKGWNDMPAEARSFAQQMIDDGAFRKDLKTMQERRAQYAADYFALEAR